MGGKDLSAAVTEACDSCRRDTKHEIAIELRMQSASNETAGAPREPYRVGRCRVCGATTTRRMADD